MIRPLLQRRSCLAGVTVLAFLTVGDFLFSERNGAFAQSKPDSQQAPDLGQSSRSSHGFSGSA